MHIRIILGIFEKYKYPGIIFFSEASDVFQWQPCLKTTELYNNLLIYVAFFTFPISYQSASISFHLLFSVSPSFFFFVCFFFLKPYSSVVEKLIYVCVCIYMYSYMCVCLCTVYIIYIIKFINFCLANKLITFWFHSFD